VEAAKLLSAGMLSAALFLGAPAADAKVILVQPQVKNFVTGAEPAKVPGAPKAAKAAKAKGPPAAAMTSEGGDVQGLILPITLVVLGGGAVAWNALDPGLAEMMKEGSAKNSTTFAGYEPVLKNTPFYGGSGAIPSSLPGNNAGKGASKKGAMGATPKKGKKFF
jgi:hypothetical protein